MNCTYIAFLDQDNIVTRVIGAPTDGQDWAAVWGAQHGVQCLTTCKMGSIRHQYARPGFTYYAGIDSFIEPSPYPSWILSLSTKSWEPPVPMPTDGKTYTWNEASTAWDEDTDPTFFNV